MNPITNEYYLPGEASDARMKAFIDIETIILTGPVRAHVDATSGLGGIYQSARGYQWKAAEDAVRNIYKGPIKSAMTPGWGKAFDFIQKLPGPLKKVAMEGFKAVNLAHYSGASKLYTYGDYASGFGKWEERTVRFFGGVVEYISGKGQ